MIHEPQAGEPSPTADESRPKSRSFSRPPKCPSCGKRALKDGVADYSTKAKYDGRLYDLHLEKLPALVCSECSEHVFGVDADERIQDALREKVGVLSPKEIRDERTRLGLTQSALAEALGIAETSVSRWESRAVIQSKSMDRFLRVLFRFQEVREYLSPKIAETPATRYVVPPDSLADLIRMWMRDPTNLGSMGQTGMILGRLAHHFGEEIAPDVQDALRALDRERIFRSSWQSPPRGSRWLEPDNPPGVIREHRTVREESDWEAGAAGDLSDAEASRRALWADDKSRPWVMWLLPSEPDLSPSIAIARIARFLEASRSRLAEAESHPRK